MSTHKPRKGLPDAFHIEHGFRLVSRAAGVRRWTCTSSALIMPNADGWMSCLVTSNVMSYAQCSCPCLFILFGHSNSRVGKNSFKKTHLHQLPRRQNKNRHKYTHILLTFVTSPYRHSPKSPSYPRPETTVIPDTPTVRNSLMMPPPPRACRHLAQTSA